MNWPEITEKITARFWSKVKKTPTCWLWTDKLSKNGYGTFKVISHVSEYSHRISWILHRGKIPKGLFVCHRCDVRNCINPKHLWLGTQKQNNQDMWVKGRNARGENHGRAKLSENDIVEIRQKCVYRKGVGKLAKEYGINRGYLHFIVNKGVWKNVVTR